VRYVPVAAHDPGCLAEHAESQPDLHSVAKLSVEPGEMPGSSGSTDGADLAAGDLLRRPTMRDDVSARVSATSARVISVAPATPSRGGWPA
jgi:hypothetical protein